MVYQSGEHQTMMHKLTISGRNEIGELQQTLSKTGCLEELQKLAELLARYNGQPNPSVVQCVAPASADRLSVAISESQKPL